MDGLQVAVLGMASPLLPKPSTCQPPLITALYRENSMKILLLFLFSCCVLPAFACVEESKSKTKVFARVIQKDSSGLDIAVFYPKKIQNAELNSVTFSYYKGKEFILLVGSTIRNSAFGLPNIDLEKYSSSYVAIKAEEISNVAISISYSLPAGSDGAFTPCGPVENFRLHEIIEGV